MRSRTRADGSRAAPSRDEQFADYVSAHRARFMRTARLLTAGDDAGAEDLVQSTLVRLYLAWSRVGRADSPLAYGYTTLTHTFLEERRRAFRRREVMTGEAVDRRGDALEADHAADVETRSLVLDALRRLPPRQRAVVVLRHFLDYDVATAAQVLGCSPGTVKSQNAKALSTLRELIGAPTLTEGS